MTNTYIITGMTCNGCKNAVEKHLSALQKVTHVSVDFENAEAVINMAQYVSINELQKALPDKFIVTKKKIQNIFKEAQTLEVNSVFTQLKPLFIIFAYIIIASILRHYQNWNWSNFMLDFMGLFYIVFSFFKILDLKGFSESFKMYDPLAKRVSGYSKAYPFIELILGVLFLMRIQILLILVVTIIILGITTIGVTKALLNKKPIQCACLGTVLKLPMTKATFIENTIMIVMALFMLVKIYQS